MPEEEPTEIAQEIIQERQDLGRHLQELETTVERATDVKTYLGRQPGLFIGLAMAGGALLITLVANRFRR